MANGRGIFPRDSNYIRTELLQDPSKKDVYLTIDYWTSKSARDAFRDTYVEEFNALDKKREAYTVDDVLIGDFTIDGPGASR